MVTVYSHWVTRLGEKVVAEHRRTVEGINLIGGQIIPDSAEQVDVSLVDRHQGRYMPERKTKDDGC